MALGLKRIETRGHNRFNGHRGLLAIAATATWNKGVLDWFRQPFVYPDAHEMRQALQQAGARPDNLPLGAVLCVVNVVDCVRAEDLLACCCYYDMMKTERIWGDYSPGRFGIVTDRCWRFREPIPTKGKQGLWDWEPPENWRELCEEATKIEKGG